MTKNEIQEQDEGLELAKRMAEEEEGIGRRPKGYSQYVIPVVCVVWSIFQLSIASWLILDSTFIRAIHLGFALLVVYLNYPLFKKTRFGLKYFSATNRIPILDYIIGIIAAFSALYIAIDYVGMTSRYGDPVIRDIVIGLTLVVLLLEAARRVIGPALPVIAIFFIIYAFFGPYMPDLIAFKGVSLNRFMGQMTMSTEGIYGIPLDVSATIVFLFVLFGAMLDKAGAGRYFIQLALSLLGGFKGGPAKAAVMGSGLTGLVSGSSIANIVTTGTFTIPLMKKVGYPAKKAAAVEVAASTDGQLARPLRGGHQGRCRTGLRVLRGPVLHYPYRSLQAGLAGHAALGAATLFQNPYFRCPLSSAPGAAPLRADCGAAFAGTGRL
jgi:TRAP transporter 4TM/12TM fusion protein